MAVGDRVERAGIDPDAPRHLHVSLKFRPYPARRAAGFVGIRRCRSALSVAVLVGASGHLGQPRDRDDPFAVADLEHDNAGAAAPRDADVVHRHADHHAGIGHQHQLIVVPDREHRDNRVAAAAQIHVVEPLPAAPGDAVVIGRAAHAEALFGDAQHEFLAPRQIGERFLGNRRLGAAVPRHRRVRPSGSPFWAAAASLSSPIARRRSRARLRYALRISGATSSCRRIDIEMT